MRAPSTRAMMSCDPPGANPTTRRSGFAPRSCASDGAAIARPITHAMALEYFFMSLPCSTCSFGLDARIFHDFTPAAELVAHERREHGGARVGFRIDAGGGELAGHCGHGNGLDDRRIEGVGHGRRHVRRPR